MARRTPAQIYQDLLTAGFPPAVAVTMTQVALGESGGDDRAIGDSSLQDATWGPSVGIYQIRTLKAETGKGSDRDIVALMGDPARQARAAWNISKHGADLTPWTVFNTGAYQRYAQVVKDALGGLVGGVAGVVVDAAGHVVDGAKNTAQNAVGSALTGARSIAIEGGATVFGLGLVALGLLALARRQARRAVS